jgi:hypothetical protein
VTTTYPSRLGPTAFGLGLYAVADLPSGTAVERFEGPVVCYHEVPESERLFAILIGEDRWLIPCGAARHINHSCAPNCWIDDGLRIVTRRPVRAGEELCFAYNWIHPGEDPARFSWDPRWSFRCGCRSPGCQGMIDRYRVAGANNSPPLRGRGGAGG